MWINENKKTALRKWGANYFVIVGGALLLGQWLVNGMLTDRLNKSKAELDSIRQQISKLTFDHNVMLRLSIIDMHILQPTPVELADDGPTPEDIDRLLVNCDWIAAKGESVGHVSALALECERTFLGEEPAPDLLDRYGKTSARLKRLAERSMVSGRLFRDYTMAVFGDQPTVDRLLLLSDNQRANIAYEYRKFEHDTLSAFEQAGPLREQLLGQLNEVQGFLQRKLDESALWARRWWSISIAFYVLGAGLVLLGKHWEVSCKRVSEKKVNAALGMI